MSIPNSAWVKVTFPYAACHKALQDALLTLGEWKLSLHQRDLKKSASLLSKIQSAINGGNLINESSYTRHLQLSISNNSRSYFLRKMTKNVSFLSTCIFPGPSQSSETTKIRKEPLEEKEENSLQSTYNQQHNNCKELIPKVEQYLFTSATINPSKKIDIARHILALQPIHDEIVILQGFTGKCMCILETRASQTLKNFLSVLTPYQKHFEKELNRIHTLLRPFFSRINPTYPSYFFSGSIKDLGQDISQIRNQYQTVSV